MAKATKKTTSSKVKSKAVKMKLPGADDAPPKLKKVLICTPAYNGQVNIGYMTSVLKAMMQATQRGYEINVFTNTDSLITRARNNAVATFLDGDWDFLFWIDADISFEPEQFYRVLNIDRDIAAATYPLKTLFYPAEPTKLTGRDLEAFMLRYAMALDGDIDNIPADGFVPVKETATGFMSIKRSCLENLIENMPELKYVSDQERLGAPASKNHYLLFDTMVEDGRYLSEDYAFCWRAQRLGFEIWVDLASTLTHTGSFDFKGSVQATNQAAVNK